MLVVVWPMVCPFFIFSFHFITNLNRLFYSHPQRTQKRTLGLRVQEMVGMGPNDASRHLAYVWYVLFFIFSFYFITNLNHLFIVIHNERKRERRVLGCRKRWRWAQTTLVIVWPMVCPIFFSFQFVSSLTYVIYSIVIHNERKSERRV